MATEANVTHVLKTWPGPFQAVWDGNKTAEFRRDDRGFRVGDTLCLLEYDPDGPQGRRFSGREVAAEITHIAGNSAFGIPEGYAMLSISRKRGADAGGLCWSFD